MGFMIAAVVAVFVIGLFSFVNKYKPERRPHSANNCDAGDGGAVYGSSSDCGSSDGGCGDGGGGGGGD